MAYNIPRRLIKHIYCLSGGAFFRGEGNGNLCACQRSDKPGFIYSGPPARGILYTIYCPTSETGRVVYGIKPVQREEFIPINKVGMNGVMKMVAMEYPNDQPRDLPHLPVQIEGVVMLCGEG